MTELLKLVNLQYEIKDHVLFEKVNGSVEERDIIGIIGKNGAGKSTLLQLINNEQNPTDGRLLWLQKDVKVEMVEQETESYSFGATTVLEEKLMEKWHVPKVEFSSLSGGEKLKARLANGFSKQADLLLLDEPTNHLDQQGLELLQKQIRNYRGTIIMVSHDRHFLDGIANKIWSIEGKQLIEHRGNYSSYMEVRKQRRITQQREYEKQQKRIEQIENQMKELTSWSNKAHAQSTKQDGYKEYYRKKAKRMDTQVKSKQKRLEKELEKTKAQPVEPDYQVTFTFKANNKVGKRFIEVNNLIKSFQGRILLKNVNFTVKHGEKVSITGPNGSGKTTLLKILLGDEPAEGKIWISPSANIGYLTQEVFDLPLNQTPAQLFHRETFEARGKVQTLMKHLGFMASQWSEPISEMSMGERVKCKLMKYILEEKDALVLDEPTNHLDLPSREQLEDTLSKYPGTLIVVSHDRYFLEKTTSTKLIITDNTVEKERIDASKKRNNDEELRLQLETERQEVLGKLSFMTPADKHYKELDQRFTELTKRINKLKRTQE
ncbi:ribosomal protection-like ABC-F family protein [Sediminibacillus massiliensis]|uniref:ribosomal protection-like ABC-F family protein n=1 Tax=Sediminibacillus massiliensis TaxID=1926277 RepID=UPI0009887B48|nr:ABC-F type ribosomal protection protein [Sediminibacillus massiliensis]